jgi:hypothetical protein
MGSPSRYYHQHNYCWIDGREMLFGQFELAAKKVGTILNIEQTVVEKSLEMIRKEFIQEIL